MLVLSRKEQQVIHIGENVVVRIFAIEGRTVRIGIEAPADVVVLRGEVKQRKQEDREDE